MQKCSTGTDSDGHSDGDSYGQFPWKLLKFHLISTDIGAKMGTVPIGIGIRRCIRIGLGSVETLLHITIEPIFICIGIGIGIGVGQWKHTIILFTCHAQQLGRQFELVTASLNHVLAMQNGSTPWPLLEFPIFPPNDCKQYISSSTTCSQTCYILYTPFTSVHSNLEHGLAIFSPLKSEIHNLPCWSPNQK